jgi:hypothetical protein
MLMFEPRVRDMAVVAACTNLVWAGVLRHVDVSWYMLKLASLSDEELARVLCYSRLLLDGYLSNCWCLN